MNKYILFLLLLFSSIIISAQSQPPAKSKILSLDDVITIACKQSPDALRAKHTFRASYWQFRIYKAGRLPQLTFNGTLPNLNRSMTQFQQLDGSNTFIYTNSMYTGGGLSLTQPIALTGGQISLQSNLNRIDNFSDSIPVSYGASPISISISQPINGFNQYKWNKKIEPLQYEKSQKTYLTNIEEIATKAINYFFGLASAQLNNDIAKLNLQNADTLYIIGKGRYNIGVIAEDELLQLELSLINSRIKAKESELELMQKQSDLIRFLGFDKTENISLILPETVPEIMLDYEKVLLLSYENNPKIVQQQIDLLQAEMSFAKQKSERAFNADLIASYSLDQTAYTLQEAYQNPTSGQVLGITVSIPIVDWGTSKGAYKMAKSNKELTEMTVKQAQQQFEQDVFNSVMQINFQNELFLAARKSDTVAQLRYTISRKRYLIGKITALQLNDAQTKRDASTRNFLSSIQRFWTNYYAIRKLTLYDFLNDQKLVADFDDIIK